jgi:hypothetical protein
MNLPYPITAPTLKLIFFMRVGPMRAMAFSFMRFLITHNDVPHSVGLLWASDQLVAETSLLDSTQHSQETSIPRRDSNPQS